MNIIEITRCVNACGLSYIRPYISAEENGIIDTRAALWRHAIRPAARILDWAHALGMEHANHSRIGTHRARHLMR